MHFQLPHLRRQTLLQPVPQIPPRIHLLNWLRECKNGHLKHLMEEKISYGVMSTSPASVHEQARTYYPTSFARRHSNHSIEVDVPAGDPDKPPPGYKCRRCESSEVRFMPHHDPRSLPPSHSTSLPLARNARNLLKDTSAAYAIRPGISCVTALRATL